MEQPLDVVVLLALALAPVVFLFTYVYLRDEYEREPLIYLIITFILGLSTAFPVIWIEEQLHTYTNITLETSPLIYAFIYVALVEEGMKYLVLRWYNYPHKEFDEPYDGIMYGVAVSLGFAAIENVMYVYYSTGDPIGTGIGRMFTAVPAHAMFGVLMGYFVGRAKFMVSGNLWLERMKGLGAAILFHGLYDYFLFLGNSFYVPFALFTLGVGVFLARKAIKMHAHISPHR